MSGERLLIPVSDSSTIRETVDYAVERLLETEEGGTLRFVLLYPSRTDLEYQQPKSDPYIEAGIDILERVDTWVEEDAGDRVDLLTVETARVGADQFLFSSTDVARAIRDEAMAHDIDRVIFDPEYDANVSAPLVRPLAAELDEHGLVVEEAPIQRRRRRRSLVSRVTPLRAGALFGVAFVFYLLVSGALTTFNLVTGAASAVIVAVALGRISLNADPSWRTPRRLLRLLVYVPYLLKEIIVSNIRVAAVILHPRLPIEPRMVTYQPAVWQSVPATVLANSITLTPGTLTVRAGRAAGDRLMLIHTLVPWAREGLVEGGLERAVRFVFYGRSALSIATPEERGDTDVIDPQESDES